MCALVDKRFICIRSGQDGEALYGDGVVFLSMYTGCGCIFSGLVELSIMMDLSWPGPPVAPLLEGHTSFEGL